jgi:hypothetical protein
MNGNNKRSAPRADPATDQKPRTASSVVASVMDDCFKVPGTNIRFGLDPILGLFPGLGDTLASLVGLAILGEGARRGLSRMVLVTMALNILINAAVGSIPLVGDAFSVWFKSNRRNHDLLSKFTSTAMPAAEREKAVRSARRFAIFLIIGVIIGVILIVALALTLLRFVIQAVSG